LHGEKREEAEVFLKLSFFQPGEKTKKSTSGLVHSEKRAKCKKSSLILRKIKFVVLELPAVLQANPGGTRRKFHV
jgi:hypothetical protein